MDSDYGYGYVADSEASDDIGIKAKIGDKFVKKRSFIGWLEVAVAASSLRILTAKSQEKEGIHPDQQSRIIAEKQLEGPRTVKLQHPERACAPALN